MPVPMHPDEQDRPLEWLRQLEQDPYGYARLAEEHASLAVAAYRVARARCRVMARSTHVPTAAELGVAAQRVVRGAGLGHPSSPSALAAECEAFGLLVIGGLRAA